MINTYEKKVLQPAEIKAGAVATPPAAAQLCPSCGAWLPKSALPVVICGLCRIQVRPGRR